MGSDTALVKEFLPTFLSTFMDQQQEQNFKSVDSNNWFAAKC